MPQGKVAYLFLEFYRFISQHLSVYAYIPTENGICGDKDILCNDDFGVSIQRGAYSFPTGQ